MRVFEPSVSCTCVKLHKKQKCCASFSKLKIATIKCNAFNVTLYHQQLSAFVSIIRKVYQNINGCFVLSTINKNKRILTFLFGD